MARRWGRLIGSLVVLVAACSWVGGDDDGGAQDAHDAPPVVAQVCELLEQRLAQATGVPFVGDEETVADLLERIAREAREEQFTVTAYLEPGRSDDEVAAAAAAVEGAIEPEIVVVTAAQAFLEFKAMFDDHPSVVEAVDEASLPASIRFLTDDIADIDRATAALAATSTPAFRVVDSRDFSEVGARALAVFASPLLDQLARVDDEEVADAASVLGATTPENDAEALDAALLLAERAAACG